ncbi:MAG: lipocalin-like domain-containing protein [Proteobacteria bacterium]|nr:lipocalin-like domain-containing protein [Pseudomonadota bacterium]
MHYSIRKLFVAIVLLLGNLVMVTAVTAASADEQFVGTFRLVGFEIKDGNGNWMPDENRPGNGYITYSDTGYMGVQITPSVRTPFANNQPTAEEARQALQGYIAYFGPFTVHEDEGYVVHHRVGAPNPGGAGDTLRFFDFEGNRLILTPPSAGGNKADAVLHVVWERMPDVELSAEAQKFVGVRQLLYTERYTERNGAIMASGQHNESDAGSYIFYTPTGHMMVHLMDRAGRTPYAGNAPTPAEALAAYRSYYAYFGRFTVYETASPQYLVHNLEGILRPDPPADTERLYQLDGDILRLGPRPQRSNGEATGTHLYWQELPSRR